MKKVGRQPQGQRGHDETLPDGAGLRDGPAERDQPEHAVEPVHVVAGDAEEVEADGRQRDRQRDGEREGPSPRRAIHGRDGEQRGQEQGGEGERLDEPVAPPWLGPVPLGEGREQRRLPPGDVRGDHGDGADDEDRRDDHPGDAAQHRARARWRRDWSPSWKRPRLKPTIASSTWAPPMIVTRLECDATIVKIASARSTTLVSTARPHLRGPAASARAAAGLVGQPAGQLAQQSLEPERGLDVGQRVAAEVDERLRRLRVRAGQHRGEEGGDVGGSDGVPASTPRRCSLLDRRASASAR